MFVTTINSQQYTFSLKNLLDAEPKDLNTIFHHLFSYALKKPLKYTADPKQLNKISFRSKKKDYKEHEIHLYALSYLFNTTIPTDQPKVPIEVDDQKTDFFQVIKDLKKTDNKCFCYIKNMMKNHEKNYFNIKSLQNINVKKTKNTATFDITKQDEITTISFPKNIFNLSYTEIQDTLSLFFKSQEPLKEFNITIEMLSKNEVEAKQFLNQKPSHKNLINAPEYTKSHLFWYYFFDLVQSNEFVKNNNIKIKFIQKDPLTEKTSTLDIKTFIKNNQDFIKIANQTILTQIKNTPNEVSYYLIKKLHQNALEKNDFVYNGKLGISPWSSDLYYRGKENNLFVVDQDLSSTTRISSGHQNPSQEEHISLINPDHKNILKVEGLILLNQTKKTSRIVTNLSSFNKTSDEIIIGKISKYMPDSITLANLHNPSNTLFIKKNIQHMGRQIGLGISTLHKSGLINTNVNNNNILVDTNNLDIKIVLSQLSPNLQNKNIKEDSLNFGFILYELIFGKYQQAYNLINNPTNFLNSGKTIQEHTKTIIPQQISKDISLFEDQNFWDVLNKLICKTNGITVEEALELPFFKGLKEVSFQLSPFPNY